MKKLSANLKNKLQILKGGKGHRWTAKTLLKAVHLIYGNKVTVRGFKDGFHGNNTRLILVCNECGYGKDGNWTPLFRSITSGAVCRRCHFSGKCLRLDYDIIQERLNKKHTNIIIFPFMKHPYKNNNTKFLAFDTKTDELWLTCYSNLQEGKRAPKANHTYNPQKEYHSYNYYIHLLKHRYYKDRKYLCITLLEKYHGARTRINIHDIRDKRHKYDKNASIDKIIEETRNNNDGKFYHLPKQTKIARDKFFKKYRNQNNIFLPNIKYIYNHFSTNIRIRAFCLNCDYGTKEAWYTYPDDLNQKHFTCPKCNKKKQFYEERIAGKRHLIHWYKNQSNIYIPQFKRIVKRYQSNRQVIHCICKKCRYGKKGEWTETINKLLTGTQCPRCTHSLPITIPVARKRISKLFHNQVSFKVPHNKLTNYENTTVIAHNKKTHKTWSTTLQILLSGSGYMYNSTSKGEVASGQQIQSYGIIKQNNNKKLPINNHYVYSYVFKHLTYHEKLHADFIININGHYIVIEYDGNQHYAISGHKDDDLRSLIIRRGRDHIKTNYCKGKKNFNIIRIRDLWNLHKMSDIKHLVHTTLDQQLLPLLHKYSHSTSTQLSLF